jgi:hypothetical protein
MVKTEELTPLAIAACAVVAITAGFTMFQKIKKSSDSTKDHHPAKSKEETWESHVVDDFGSLQEIWPGTLFSVEATGAGQGPPLRNMHIYRVPDGSKRLVIFNGIAIKEETMRRIESLGQPSVLVVPNCYHRCCAAVWKQRYPDIVVVTPECAMEKAAEVVPVDMSTQEWGKQKEWSPWVRIQVTDGWDEFETILELQLENTMVKNGKKASLVCDMLFTLPYPKNAGMMHNFLTWVFDSSITLPEDGKSIVVPKVARLSRIFAIKDWTKAEQWFRDYAREEGPNVAVILVGHGVPVKEIDTAEGCTKALEGVADQLAKPRW